MQQIAEVAEGSWLDSWPGTVARGSRSNEAVEMYEMLNGTCEDEIVKPMRAECQETRYLPLEGETGIKCTELQHNQCMNNTGRSTFCTVNMPYLVI